MPKVKLTVGRAGPGLNQAAGETVEVDHATAQRMIESGQATAVGGGGRPKKSKQPEAKPDANVPDNAGAGD